MPRTDDYLGFVFVILFLLLVHRVALVLAHLAGHPALVPEIVPFLSRSSLQPEFSETDRDNVLEIEWKLEESIKTEVDDESKFNSLKRKKGDQRWSHPSLTNCDYKLGEAVLGTDLPGGNYGT